MTLPHIIRDQPIRAFALLCVATNTAFFGYLAIWLVNILSSPGWCGKAIQAERITPGATFTGLTACIDLLKMQVASIAQALLIVLGTEALCLGVLVVIVIAGAKLAGKLPGGGEIDVSPADSKADTLNAAGDALKQKASETEQPQ